MATLPANVTTSQTVQAIYSLWEAKPQRLSRRLGASQIGRPCDAELWYAFRWCGNGGQFDGRMLRLFNRGHREEAVFTEELRGIGCEVLDVDPRTGEQFEFTGCGGHLVAKIDGVAVRGVPEAPKTPHNLSYKTSNAKGFAGLAKDGVEKARPEHAAQNQLEMRLAQLDRTLYLVVNKDTDELYSERLRRDDEAGERLMARAERVVFSPEPLERVSEDPAFYLCKGCAMARVCHTAALPPVSCRTCLHATPERDGDGRWSCARHKCDVSTDDQRAAGEHCPDHLYIPALLKRWGEVVDASEPEGWVEYRAADGLVFRNGPWGLHSFTSRELHAASPELLRHAEFMAIRARHAGVIVEDVEEAA